MRLGPHTIKVWRAGPSAEDEYHNEIPGDPVSHDVFGCSAQPGPSSEFLVDRSATTTAWTIWAPISADVLNDDEIEYSGDRYEIDGSVDRWQFGTPLDHLVIRLRATKG